MMSGPCSKLSGNRTGRAMTVAKISASASRSSSSFRSTVTSPSRPVFMTTRAWSRSLAAACAPAIRPPANGPLAILSPIRPTIRDRLGGSCCAGTDGRKFSSLAACSTRRLVASAILVSRPLSTSDTVVRDTPARSATSFMIGRRLGRGRSLASPDSELVKKLTPDVGEPGRSILYQQRNPSSRMRGQPIGKTHRFCYKSLHHVISHQYSYRDLVKGSIGQAMLGNRCVLGGCLLVFVRDLRSGRGQIHGSDPSLGRIADNGRAAIKFVVRRDGQPEDGRICCSAHGQRDRIAAGRFSGGQHAVAEPAVGGYRARRPARPGLR